MATAEAVQTVSSRLDHVVSRLDAYAAQVQGQFDAQDKRAATAKEEFQELTGKLDKFAEILAKNASESDNRQSVLDQAVQSVHSTTQAQLQAGDERIATRLAELDV